MNPPVQRVSPRAKYLTLVLLLAWVAAVFGYTLYKFSVR